MTPILSLSLSLTLVEQSRRDCVVDVRSHPLMVSTTSLSASCGYCHRISAAADQAASQTVERHREPSQAGAVRLIDIDAEDEAGCRKVEIA